MRRPTLSSPLCCNCWVWAHWQFWRYGGYVAKRRSRFSRCVNHYLWSPDLKTWWSYKALSDKRRGWWFEAIWFRGEVREGD